MGNTHKKLHRIHDAYREIVNEQSKIGTDMLRLRELEHRADHLKGRLTHLESLENAEAYAKEAKNIIHHEKRFLDEMQRCADRTLDWAKRQRRRIRDMRRSL